MISRTVLSLFTVLSFAYISVYVSIADDDTKTACEIISDYLCSNSPDACGCDEFELNCDVCNDNNNVPCSECIDGYFLADANYKCANCQSIFGNNCKHCTNGRGCQQCNDNTQPIYDPSCGLYTCGDIASQPTPNPTPNPTPQPSPSPTPQPTPLPTPQPTPNPTPIPTTLNPTYQPTSEPVFSFSNSIARGSEDLFSGNDDSTFDLYDENSNVCINPIICGGQELVYKLFGLCDLGTLSVVKNVNFHIDTIFYDIYLCCENSIYGKFWINGDVYTKYTIDENYNFIIDTYAFNAYDETDIDALTALLSD